jgi:predicted secreted protein
LFTEKTAEGAYSMLVGDTSSLRLGPKSPPPEVEGSSVLVLELAFLTDPGYKEWELRAVEPGETTVTVESGSEPLTFLLVVGEWISLP